ncbi:hypothetical protein NHX12_033147, partial [Muraenolepis orangiensis]
MSGFLGSEPKVQLVLIIFQRAADTTAAPGRRERLHLRRAVLIFRLQTPASPANTLLDPSSLGGPPSELFASFSPTSVPS